MVVATPSAVNDLRIRWTVDRSEKVEHLRKILWPKHRERPISDEEIRPNRRCTINITRNRVHGYSIVQSDPGSDQSPTFHTRFNNEKHIGAPSNDPVTGREPPAADP